MSFTGDYDYVLKIIVIGDSGVGKTSLLSRYIDNTFTTNSETTIGVDFKFSILEIMGKAVKLQIWDVSGQQRFREVSLSYCQRADAIVLVFDVTNKKTFDSLSKWLLDLDKNSAKGTPIILVGNKADDKHNRQIDEASARAAAKDMGLNYYETSAKTSHNVESIFSEAGRLAYDRLGSHPTTGNVIFATPTDDDDKAAEKCCIIL